MPSDLRIDLLGEFQVSRDGEVVPTLESRRLQALLGYFVLHREAPHPRHRAAFLFWPDSTEGQALTNLRQLLHHLRKELPHCDECLRVGRATVQWRPGAPARVDLIELDAAERAAAEARRAENEQGEIVALRTAVDLYSGDLLRNCDDPWIDPHREGLRRTVLDAVERLAALLEVRRDYDEAAQRLERLLELEPLRESAGQRLIRVHMLRGDRPRALETYGRLRRILADELGVEPAAETEHLLKRIRRGGTRPDVGERDPPALQHNLRLVGRHREWVGLHDAWERASAGRPGFVLLTGEAGIGKTKLAAAFSEWAQRQYISAAYGRSWAAEGVLSFGPVAQWLRADALQRSLHRLDPVWVEEVSRVVPAAAPKQTAFTGEAATAAAAPDGGRRLRLFEGLARAVLASGDPLLLVLDDLQWSDAETLDWLHYLLRFDPHAPLLLVATLRAGEPFTDERLSSRLLELRRFDGFQEIALGPLTEEDTASLGSAVAGRELAASEVDSLHGETEGNPLFVIEMLRAQAGTSKRTGPLPPYQVREGSTQAALPERLHWVIRGRLEQLSDRTREIVPLLATVGRDLTWDVVRQASAAPDVLADALDELIARNLLEEKEDQGFGFTHDKIREVAYAGMSTARRAFLHERVAEALQRAHAEEPDDVAGEVARHLERAGRGTEALPWRHRAGARALAVHAYSEATEHLEKALALLATAPDTTERRETELQLQTALGVPLVAMHHYSGVRVWSVYRRAQELCEQLGRPRSAPVLRGLALASLMRSRLPDVGELGRRLMSAAEREDDPMLRVEAHYVMGVALYWQGRLPAAAEHLGRSLALYRPDRAPEHLHLFAQDPAVICGVRLALCEWHLGEAGRARQRCLETLDHARKIGHPFSLAYARCFGTWVLIECGDLPGARRETAALLKDSREQELPVWPEWGGVAEGFLLAEVGHVDAGVERMATAATEYAAAELSLGFPYHQSLYARALALGRRFEEGMAALDAALGSSARTGEHFWDAELHRLQGDLLAAMERPKRETRACYERALSIARSQDARSLVARARRSLDALD